MFIDIKKRIKKNELLSKYTTFRIGGPAQYFFIAETKDDLINGIRYALYNKLPYYILGAGSNILVSDEGYKGLIIKTNNKDINAIDNKITAAAGISMGALALRAAELGLGGFEWAIGVPGSFGGAIRGNAGAYGGEIKDVLYQVEILVINKNSSTTIATLGNKDCNFHYRDSIFKHNKNVILAGTIELKNSTKENALQAIKEFVKLRNLSQGSGNICAGCIFKNYQLNEMDINNTYLQNIIPNNFLKNKIIPTGWLIEQAGLKGTGYGGALVSLNHGNFVLNHNKATAKEVRELINMVKQKIYDKFKIKISEEIEYLGF